MPTPRMSAKICCILFWQFGMKSQPFVMTLICFRLNMLSTSIQRADGSLIPAEQARDLLESVEELRQYTIQKEESSDNPGMNLRLYMYTKLGNNHNHQCQSLTMFFHLIIMIILNNIIMIFALLVIAYHAFF